MVASFERLVGAAGDVRELEYISALHQTDPTEVRSDASIKAEDIRYFLSSRYGIMVDEEQVRTTILNGLGGGEGEDGDVLDMMEVVAILLIPTFLKAAVAVTVTMESRADEVEEAVDTRRHRNALPEGIVPVPPGLLDYVLKMILQDVTGDKNPKELTPDLIRRILVAYGECDLAADDTLVKEMYDAAVVGGSRDVEVVYSDTSTSRPSTRRSTPTTAMLNVQSFSEALTHDIKLYDIRNETRMTTNFDDVYVTAAVVQAKEEEMLATISDNTKAYEEELLRGHRETQQYRDKLAASEELDRVDTIPSIDITAGTYRSKGLLVLLWVTILITYFAYFTNFDRNIEESCTKSEGYAYEFDSPWRENQGAMLCEALVSVFNWLVFFFGMSIFGIICVTLGSVGNEVDCSTPWKPMVGMSFVLLLVFVPYIFMRDPDSERTENNLLYGASVILGLITSSFHLSQAIALYVSSATKQTFRSYIPNIHPFFRSTIAAERAVKHATAQKLSMMTNNALEIVKVKTKDSMLNHYGQALKNYETCGNQNFETVGGFVWAWKRHLGSSQIFAREGIWIPSRMIASNIAQYVVAFYILIGGLVLTDHVSSEYDQEWAKQQLNVYVDRIFDYEAEDEVADAMVANVTSAVSQYLTAAEARGTDFGCGDFASTASSTDEFLETYCGGGSLQCDTSANVNYLCPLLDSESNLNSTTQAALLNASGFDDGLVRQAAYQVAQQAATDSVDSLFPSEKYMVVVPMYVGTVLAFLVAISLALVYIPSVTSTMFKLRCGVIPTLRDKDYNRNRIAPEQVAILTGSLFWGSLFSSIIVGGGIGLIVFFFLWQASVYYAQRLVAILVGMISVFLVRFTMVRTCRCAMYKGLYRSRPRPANISMLALEWGNFALSAGYILVRSIMLLLAAAAYIGRIDTPFLAPNVGRFGFIQLDNYPNIHTKDILSHEAHRHPYIEQLGVFYLSKLRFAQHFGQRAGTCWRLIFVHALMPWLHRYRILARPKKAESQHLNEVENRFPSLRFISLRKIHAPSELEDEAVMPALSERIAENGDKNYILELEKEVERLKEMLEDFESAPAINPSSTVVKKI